MNEAEGLAGELDAEALIVGLMVLGGAAQHAFGGPWLLMAGTAALGPRIAMAGDDRRAGIVTAGGCAIWLALHWLLGRDLGRIQVAAEVLTFLAFVAVFWSVRLTLRARAEGGEAAVESESVEELERRLELLKAESASRVQEREAWVGLFAIMKNLGEVIRMDDIVEVVKEATRVHLKMPAYVLLLAKDGAITVRAQLGGDDATMSDAALPAGRDSLAGWFLGQRDPVLVDDLREDPRFHAALLPYQSLVALPLWVGDEAAGVLVALDREGRAFNRNDFQRAGILSKQLALGLGKTLLYEQVEELSITDGLTRLYRHRYFQERFEGELERARRYGRPLALLMADLDSFKAYNDRYGHLEGDEVLRLAARAMQQHFRRQAILARYGGEEFAVILPDTTKEQAAEEAERFRRALAGMTVPAGLPVLTAAGRDDRPPVTISGGVAAFPADAQTRRDLIARADAALYQAKHAGRNRICAFDAAVTPPEQGAA
ncbi:MAG: sensor domain-containing diguanylate cyclase [bacterium]